MLIPAISQFIPIQFRLSESLVLLAFFRPDFALGLTVGCFLTNAAGTVAGLTSPIDMLFGTLATLIACLAESFLSPKLFVAALNPIVFNGINVGLELQYFFLDAIETPLYLTMAYVAAGEAMAILIGYILMWILMRNKAVRSLLSQRRHENVRF